MINRIRLLRSVGQFDYVSVGALELRRCVLVYAENGRGKTTLSAILRSLAGGDPRSVQERRRIAAENLPQIILNVQDGPAVFENGAWNRTYPNLLIFDDQFVADNVCSGLAVGPGHRQHLHELVLGAEGVRLDRRLRQLVRQIEEHNARLRERASAITAEAQGPLTTEEFCDLAPDPGIAARIQAAERELAAAREQDSIRAYREFDPIGVPPFDVGAVTALLEADLGVIDMKAAARAQEHFAVLGRGGEAWVADGMRRIGRADDGSETCPFCKQPLAASEMFGHYRAYFREEYARFIEILGRALGELDRAQPRDTPARLERALRVAAERRQFWSRYCDVPEVSLDTESLARDWQFARDGLVSALEAKRASPLEKVAIAAEALEAVERFNSRRDDLTALNGRLQAANAAVNAVKQRDAGDARAAQASYARLRAILARHSPDVSCLCEAYLAEKSAKAVTERERDDTREEIERYRAETFPAYQDSVNEHLRRFNAGFRVGDVGPADTRGGPTCNYNLIIRDTPIPVAGREPEPGEPSFRTALSSGDRNTLALAFFFSSVERDPRLGDRVLVIDDPISSLDENRSLATAQELRRLGERVSQIIILSHDRHFLCCVWSGIHDRTQCSAVALEREGDGSNIVEWDPSSDSLTDHDRNHALLRTYLDRGAEGDAGRRRVAETLRPVIETFLRVAFPGHFQAGPNGMRTFMGRCRERVGTADEVLSASDLEELASLIEYAERFHHATNQNWVPMAVNDGELRSFAERTLRFATRSPSRG